VKVLFLCHRIPYPPDKGDKIRAFHELRAMAAVHEVDLFTLADQPGDMACREELRHYCRHVTVAPLAPLMGRLRALPFLLTRRALTLPYFYSAELAAAVRGALETRSYDRIFVYCSAMAQYVEHVEGIPIMIDLVDVDSDKWAQYAAFSRFPFSAIYRREGNALRRYEREICGRPTCVVVTTEREASLVRQILVRQIAGTARVHVIPNGVDTEFFKPSGKPTEAGPPTVGFIGDMSYFPNEEAVTYFARRVLPLIRQSVPGARFLIVGRNPGRKVRKLAAIDGVEVTGFVPDIRIHLARMHATVAPFSIAAGIQNKILEAMAFGLPVVCTSRAVQGLSTAVAGAIDVTAEGEEMAAKLVTLLEHTQLARSRGMECRRRVAGEYNWEESLGRLLQLLAEFPVPEVPKALATAKP
jgi:sugar transferase (PEP-CTERM/EpsH1 system associated)